MLFEITPTAPYDFDLTVGSMTAGYFQARHAADMFEGGILRRVLPLNDKPALISVRSVGSVDAPKLAVEVIGEDLTSQPISTRRSAARAECSPPTPT